MKKPRIRIPTAPPTIVEKDHRHTIREELDEADVEEELTRIRNDEDKKVHNPRKG